MQARGPGSKGRCRGPYPAMPRWPPAWRRPSGRKCPKSASPWKRLRLPHSGRNGGLFAWANGDLIGGDGATRGNRLNLASGTGFIRSMAGRSVTIGLASCAHAATRFLTLALLALALAACSLFDKDSVAPEEPADKLYNEGLYLLNTKKDPKGAAKKFEEVDRQHPYSEWARKALIMSAFAYYQGGAYDDCINTSRRYVTLHPGSPDAAYAQFLIGSSYFDQMPEISRVRICRRRQAQDRGRARPVGGQGNGYRASIAERAQLHRRHQSLQGGGDALPEDAPRRGSPAAAHRGLYGARYRRRGADFGRRARPQLPRKSLVQGCLCTNAVEGH